MNTQGYTVELNRSAGVASAVAIDALFSGNKPEPQHADLWR